MVDDVVKFKNKFLNMADSSFSKKKNENTEKSIQWSEDADIDADSEQLIKSHEIDLNRGDRPPLRKPLPPPDPRDKNNESRVSDPSDDCI